MKKPRVLRFARFTTVCCALGAGACGDDGGSNGTGSTVTSTTYPSTTTATGTTDTSTVTTSTIDTSTVTGTGGATATMTSTTGEVDTCTVAALAVFTRSDTDAGWDDNDFSDVTIESGCPTLVNVTWPHEEGWENADPAEANFEETRFTLDSYGFSGDLTGKQLNLTIELTDDVRGPNANAGAYLVSLVSVSTYQYDPEATGTDGGTGGTCSGGTAGVGGTTTMGGTGGVGGVGGTATTGGGTAGTATTDAGTGGTATTGGGMGGMGGVGGVGGTCAETDAGLAGAGGAPALATGYTEAETPRAARLALRYVGDRATLVFPLPDKTDAIDSYDPSTAIKINVRIYNQSYDVEMPDDGMGGMGGVGGMGGMGGVGGMGGMTSTETMTTTSGTGGMGGMGGVGGMGGTGGLEGDTSTDGFDSDLVFDYISAEFAITHLSVTDRGVRP